MNSGSYKLNRDFYIKMRIKGYSHETLTSNIFPPERTETFMNDISGLENIDYTKKVDIDKLVNGLEEKSTVKKSKNKQK